MSGLPPPHTGLAQRRVLQAWVPLEYNSIEPPQSPCLVLISQTTRPRSHSVNGSNSPQKVFLGPQTRSGLSGQLRGNWWVCFISESDAVEKLLQTPRPRRQVGLGMIHVQLQAQTETMHVCLHSCLLFLLWLNILLHLESLPLPSNPVPPPFRSSRRQN